MSSIIKSSQVNIIKGNLYCQEDESVLREKELEESLEEKEYENIISIANTQARDIVNDALSEAALIKEEVLEDAKDQAVVIRKEAFDKGFIEGKTEGELRGHEEGLESGFLKGKSDAEEILLEAREIKTKAIEQKDTMLKSLEKEVIELVLDLTQKVLDVKLDEDDEVVVSLVLKGLKNLSSREDVRIRVSSDDSRVLEDSREEILNKNCLIEDLSIDIDNHLKKGDCIIETQKGDIDVSISTQLSNIEDCMRSIVDSE